MGIEMDQMKLRINPKHLLHDRKGDQMVASQKDGKFPCGKDPAKALRIKRNEILFLPGASSRSPMSWTRNSVRSLLR